MTIQKSKKAAYLISHFVPFSHFAPAPYVTPKHTSPHRDVCLQKMSGFRVLLLVGLASQCCLVSADEFVATLPFVFEWYYSTGLQVSFNTNNSFKGGSLTFSIGGYRSGCPGGEGSSTLKMRLRGYPVYPGYPEEQTLVDVEKTVQTNSEVTIPLSRSGSSAGDPALYAGFFNPYFTLTRTKESFSKYDCPVYVSKVTLQTNIITTPAPSTLAPPGEFAGKYAVVTQEACAENVVSCPKSSVQFIPFYERTEFTLCNESDSITMIFTDLKDGYFEFNPGTGTGIGTIGTIVFLCNSCYPVQKLFISVSCDLVSSLPPATDVPSTIAPSLPPGYGVPGPPGVPGYGVPGTNGQNGKDGEQGAQGAQGAAGATGATGPAGAGGLSGPAGAPGAPGTSSTSATLVSVVGAGCFVGGVAAVGLAWFVSRPRTPTSPDDYSFAA